jgi:Rrf2 family protein
MKVSKKLEYALRALIFMASREHEKIFLIKNIAALNGIPKKFLELILLELKNAGLLSSKRGVSGGYRFFIPRSKVKLSPRSAFVRGMPIANRPWNPSGAPFAP